MRESWSFGDSPALGLALNPVYHEIDLRFILEDFFAKL